MTYKSNKYTFFGGSEGSSNIGLMTPMVLAEWGETEIAAMPQQLREACKITLSPRRPLHTLVSCEVGLQNARSHHNGAIH